MKTFNVIKYCRHGKMIYNKNDMYIGKSLEVYGEYCEGEVELFRQLVLPGHTILEIGANLGAHTLVLAQLVGKPGQVHAFEPQRLLFQTLSGNMAINSMANVYIYQKAVAAEPGYIKVPVLDYEKETNWGGLELGNWDIGEEIEVVTIDSMRWEACHFIKIDVEGMELSVIQGAKQTIQRFAPILYVENDRKEKSAELIHYIAGLGYDMYWHEPHLYNENNYFNTQEDIFAAKTQDENGNDVLLPMISVNMLCLPKALNINVEGFVKVSESQVMAP